MKIFRHYEDVPPACKGAVVVIGNFDGVHLGHQALIAQARDLAEKMAAPLAVLAFEPHPQEFFHHDAECFRLTPFRTKARLLAEQGIDVMYALPFDAEMARKTAEEFVGKVLVEGLAVRGVVVGADFRFGRGRTGDSRLLTQLGGARGFATEIIKTIVARDAQKVSSSEIRNALKTGRPGDAAKLLGHWWMVEARVEHGEQRGRELGFPTANMPLVGYLKPAFGIYAVRATITENEKTVGVRNGVANLGIRPMFESPTPLLETFLFDFEGDLYGKHLAVELIAYIRPEMKFDSLDGLIARMHEDAAAARAALDRAGVGC
jgi:riboflavin kinase/FMN adenylyltransferase